MLLVEAKGLAGQGHFGAWVRENCRFGPSTARNYMRLATHDAILRLEDDPNRQPTGDLSIARALRALAAPKVGNSAPDRSDGPAAPHVHRPVGADEDQADPTVAEATEDDAGAGMARRGSKREDRRRRGAGECRHAANADPTAETQAGETKAGDDALWLGILPVRSRLDDSTVFDEQALIWRRVQPAIDHLLGLYSPTADDVRVARIQTRVRERFSYRVAQLVGAVPPERWTVCDLCGGTGSCSSLAKECDACRGGGFLIPQANEEPLVDPDGDG
jgi:hypothetical protein